MSLTTTAPRCPTVFADTGPDGRPQVMLVTPTLTTVLDRAAGAALLVELLAVLSGAG